MRALSATFAAMLVFGWSAIVSAEEPLFPFVISYDAPDNATNVSAWLDRPAGKHGFVQGRNGHLATDAGPIRFWATNVVFDACVPAHEQAERVAVRLARLGINCVRIHNVDTFSIWGHSPNKLTIDPQQLDRLDYLIYQLKLHGIYVDLGLHVGRQFGDAEGFSGRAQRPEADKGLDQFEPRMIELQKKYARDLLTHVNPYTKTAYADEPAVAFVEISNEDGLFAEWSSGQLDCLPDPYARTFRKLWNGWLRQKYGDMQKLLAVWSAGASMELGPDMLTGGDFPQPLEKHWRVDGDDQTKVELSIQPDMPNKGQRALRLVVVEPGRAAWAPVLVHGGVSFRKGAAYTVAFQIRSASAGRVEVASQMGHAPWEHLGLSTRVEVGPQWRSYRLGFLADRDEANGRIVFAQFRKGVACQLAGVSLRPGGIVGLEPGQTIEDDSVPTLGRQQGTSPASCDFCDFLWDTEHAYWQAMYRFLKDELHVRPLVYGTQLGYGSLHVQAALDYVDNHAYWQHPQFPNRPWDMKDWYTEDLALVNVPGSTLAHLAMGRVAGKAYTVSEYNHPAPNSYAAEGFPMIASFGAFQNWDGIYSFAYSHSSTFEPRRIEGFFDVKSNTAQLAHMPACAAMFLRGDVAAAARPAVFRFSREDERRRLHAVRSAWSLTAERLLSDLQYPLVHATALDLANRTAGDLDKDPPVGAGRDGLAAGRFFADTGEICWDISRKDAGYYTVNTRRSKLFTGFVAGRTFSLGNVTLKIGPTRLDWATISMVAIDGEDFDRPGRILIAATGWVQNRGAKLERLGGSRITLGDRWGQEPILCEGIKATIALPVPAGPVKCYPLDESGNRRGAIAVGHGDDAAQVELDPRHKTLWYELEIQPSGS